MRDVYEGLQQAPESTEPQNQYPGPKKEVEFEDLGDTCVPSVNGDSSLPDKVPCTLNTNLLYVFFKFYFLLLLSGGSRGRFINSAYPLPPPLSVGLDPPLSLLLIIIRGFNKN